MKKMSDEKMKDRNNRGKFDTLYNWIYNELLKMILAGQLPSEAEIAERFGVSRMTSKMALNALADENIVYRVARKGSFLAEVDLNRIRNMVDCKGVVGGSVNNLNVITKHSFKTLLNVSCRNNHTKLCNVIIICFNFL